LKRRVQVTNRTRIAKKMLKTALLAPVILVLILASIGLNFIYFMADRKSRQAQGRALRMVRSTNKASKVRWKLATQ
jgi:hypothetical protein